VLYVTLSPKGQETEMMGCFFFAGQVLGWLPPLIFTIMNENGVNMRWGFGMVSFFCAFAVLCTLPMGSYRHATELVARESEAKFLSVLKAASQHDNYSTGFIGVGNREGSAAKTETVTDGNGTEFEATPKVDEDKVNDIESPSERSNGSS
jgi:hypothetical protein